MTVMELREWAKMSPTYVQVQHIQLTVPSIDRNVETSPTDYECRCNPKGATLNTLRYFGSYKITCQESLLAKSCLAYNVGDTVVTGMRLHDFESSTYYGRIYCRYP